MKRELTSVQRHMYGTALVYPFYRLSTREQVVLLDQLIMAVETLALGSRQKAHAARCDRGLRDGDPGGQRIRRLEPVICRILMPGDERFVSWLLLEEARAPAQDIGTDQILNRVEQLRMGYEIAEERKRQVCLDAKP